MSFLGAEEWDWRKSHTQHVPGIQIADVQDLLDKNAQILILSRGVHNRLELAKETQKFLRDRQAESPIEIHFETTAKAVELYNAYAKADRRVGALIHSTC